MLFLLSNTVATEGVKPGRPGDTKPPVLKYRGRGAVEVAKHYVHPFGGGYFIYKKS
jgi:hypothetical protein